MSEVTSTMWRSMPVSFGPGAAKDRYRAGMRAITIPYLTEAEPLTRLLPRYYRLAGRPVVRVSHRHVSGVDVLAGGSYNMVGVSVDVTFAGERDDGESATGSFLLVGWKDHPAPVLTGREYSGQAELVGRLGDAVPSDDGSRSFLCSDFSGGALLRGEVSDSFPSTTTRSQR